MAYDREGTGGICVYGQYLSRDLCDFGSNLIRKAAERCDAVDSLVFVCSLSGGAAGVADRLCERAEVNDSKMT
jgi:hypothetical protein